MCLAIEVDGITHEQESIAFKDKEREKELEDLGVKFLRFDAILIVNKVEAAVREITDWIRDYEEKNGVPMIVQRRRAKASNNPPLPLPGGDATAQPSLK